MMLVFAVSSGAIVLHAIPGDLPGEGGIAQYVPHCVPVPLGAASRGTPHDVELLRYGLRADTGEVTLVDIAHETRFLGNDLQRRQLADAARR